MFFSCLFVGRGEEECRISCGLKEDKYEMMVDQVGHFYSFLNVCNLFYDRHDLALLISGAQYPNSGQKHTDSGRNVSADGWLRPPES